MSATPCFLPCPKSLEPLLVAELEGWGIDAAAVTAGVLTQLTQEQAYQACLWSRLASRVLWRVAEAPVTDEAQLYAFARAVPWEDHLDPTRTFAVQATAHHSPLQNTHYAALRVKDAIVDRFRDRTGGRPSVDLEAPDLRLMLHLSEDWGQLYLDFSGDSLHRRGYREGAGEAPLKENLAAAVLVLAGWPEIAASGGSLLDPLCGVGTLPLEAALMAADVAPGLHRRRFGFEGWLQHDPGVWQRLKATARARREAGLSRLPKLIGYDADGRLIRKALEARDRLGLQQHVHFEKRELGQLEAGTAPPGLVVANPPYGERLGSLPQLLPLYAHFGSRLKQAFGGWRGAVLTSEPELAKALGVRADKRPVLYNGRLACRLYAFDLHTRTEPGAPRLASSLELLAPEDPVRMLVNRIRKNQKRLKSWLQRDRVTCFRVYDADLPEYNLAVDVYEGWGVVQEYQAPSSVDPQKAQQRLRAALTVLPEVLGVPPERLAFKVRGRQRKGFRYEGGKPQRDFHEVGESGMRFWVNFTDTLDTGLFLDHRGTRKWIREQARNARFLNLFGYTGTATIAAAKGGACETTTVDLSPRFLEWAQQNLALNGLSERKHRLIRADVPAWLAQASGRFDLIFVDPPTFSNSARAEDFDLQRDHVSLLRQAMRLLAPEGTLLFTNHFRRFKLAPELEAEFLCESLHSRTLPPDFARNPKIHGAWTLRHRSS